MQWIVELEVTPDWNNPETKYGKVDSSDAVLQEGTRYYTWLSDEKLSEEGPAAQLLGTLDKNALQNKYSDECE
jgi:hypothetical protein